MNLSRKLPETHSAIIQQVARAASQADATVYWVGGPVRDSLLGRPVVDVDILVAGAGSDPMKRLRRIARKVAPARAPLQENERFLTVSFEVGDIRVDLAALRHEHYETPGSLPQVVAGTLEQDLLRRDFTINAMAVPLLESDGEGIDPASQSVVDLSSGQEDLAAGLLRVQHPRSFHDDPTRALRAARFAARFGFKLARSTRSALRDAIRDGAFGAVSGDRLRREFEKLFSEFAHGADPSVALARLDAWHVLGALEPGLDLPREARAPLRRLGRTLAEPPWRPRGRRPWVSGLCVWFAALKPGLRGRSVQRLSLRGDTAEKIASFDTKRRRAEKALARSRGRGAADRVLSAFDEEQLFAFHATCAPPLRRRVIRFAAEDRERRLPISGRDLAAEGLEGPVVGEVLARMRVALLDGDVANREGAIALAREIARRHRPR